MTKGEIARFEQFLLLSPCFQKVDCCRGVRKCLYEDEGKGLNCIVDHRKTEAPELKIRGEFHVLQS